MGRIEEILMERDGLTKKQAKRRVEECREAVFAALDDGADWEVDDIILDELGFELDNIDDLLW